jgi:CRISPR-associated protein Cas1
MVGSPFDVMRRHLNTLFITTEGAWLAKDGAAVDVRVEHQSRLRVPLQNLDGIVCFGWDIGISPHLMGACTENDVSISFLSPHGKLLANVVGFTSGNVLLRREQYRRADDEAGCLAISRPMVAVKIANSRNLLQRALRDHRDKPGMESLEPAIRDLGRQMEKARFAPSLDALRGIEGEAAATYFGVFNFMLTAPGDAFRFQGRNKRPPLDRVNALLSFLYALLAHDAKSALESAGLDACVGFLHRDRPGRPSLALDLMEEFRAYLADRTCLSLINRQQIKRDDFVFREGGNVEIKEDARKKVLVAYQERKQTEVRHPFLDETTTVGLLVHLQARLLARHLRGDLDSYPPFIWK